MTSREIVRRAIRFECPRRLPIDLPEPYATDFAHVRINPSPDSRCSQGVDEWGAVWHNIGVCNLGEVKDFPLKDWKDFDSLPIPDIRDLKRWGDIEGHVSGPARSSSWPAASPSMNGYTSSAASRTPGWISTTHRTSSAA